MTSSYEIRAFVPPDREALERLYQAVYGDAWAEKTNLGWTVGSSTPGAGAIVATLGDQVVAAQPYRDLPLDTPWGADRVSLFLDVATHPAHQRRGLFRRVVDRASAEAFERGGSIAMTTPNRRAARGFETMPPWARLCSLDCLVRPLGAGDRPGTSHLRATAIRAAFALASVGRLHRNGDGTRQEAPGDGIETPWLPGDDADRWSKTVAHRGGIMVARDRTFLQWRFGPDYRLFALRGAPGVAGYVASRVVTRAGVKVGLVIDCIAADAAAGSRLMAAALGWLETQGASAAVGYFLPQSMPWRSARKAGFLRLPAFLAPREYPVYACVRPGDEHGPALLDAASWHLSMADSDLA